jgi:hypothetical protein
MLAEMSSSPWVSVMVGSTLALKVMVLPALLSA